MRTGRRFRGWVIAAAVGGGASALAQSPAARLVPIDPNKAPAAPVVRSAYPDIPDADVYQVPVQGYAGQPRPAAPQPERSRTWVSGAWSGVKEFVVGKPASAELPPAAPPSARLPQPRQVPPAPAPVPQPRQPEPQPQPAAPQPGVYAGPPAYRSNVDRLPSAKQEATVQPWRLPRDIKATRLAFGRMSDSTEQSESEEKVIASPEPDQCAEQSHICQNHQDSIVSIK